MIPILRHAQARSAINAPNSAMSSRLGRPRDIVARQIDLICAPHLMSAEERLAAQADQARP